MQHIHGANMSGRVVSVLNSNLAVGLMCIRLYTHLCRVRVGFCNGIEASDGKLGDSREPE